MHQQKSLTNYIFLMLSSFYLVIENHAIMEGFNTKKTMNLFQKHVTMFAELKNNFALALSQSIF